MNEEKNQAGLGKVIYSVDEQVGKAGAETKLEKAAMEDVEEADRESFPASDPPGFTGGSVRDSE